MRYALRGLKLLPLTALTLDRSGRVGGSFFLSLSLCVAIWLQAAWLNKLEGLGIDSNCLFNVVGCYGVLEGSVCDAHLREDLPWDY